MNRKLLLLCFLMLLIFTYTDIIPQTLTIKKLMKDFYYINFNILTSLLKMIQILDINKDNLGG